MMTGSVNLFIFISMPYRIISIFLFALRWIRQNPSRIFPWICNEPFERQIRSHFSKLGLLRKYRDAIIDRLPVVLEAIKNAKTSGVAFDQVQELIRIQYQSLAKVYKSNYWETCMYEGLLSSEGVLETFFSDL